MLKEREAEARLAAAAAAEERVQREAAAAKAAADAADREAKSARHVRSRPLLSRDSCQPASQELCVYNMEHNTLCQGVGKEIAADT